VASGTPAPARARAFAALTAVERGKVTRLRDALRVDDLPARERALALELSAGVERRRLTLDAVLHALTARGRLTSDTFVRTALRMGAYQVLYLPRIPAHAAVHTAVDLLRAQRGFANALLRGLTRRVVERAADGSRLRHELPLPAGAQGPRALVFEHAALPDATTAPVQYWSFVHGVPSDLLERWRMAYGDMTMLALAEASSVVPPAMLRISLDRTDADRVAAMLEAEGVQTKPSADGKFLRVADVASVSPFATRAYGEGLFIAQDPTAAAAAEAMAAQPGEHILDLCAAPGGKTMVLAEALGGRGCVFAYDLDRTRLALVSEAAGRLRRDAVVRVVEDLALVPPCDAVLADVPCSNSGVLARRVEVRRRAIAASIATLVSAQIDLLRNALAHVRIGGRVVYSTCSLEAEENRGVVDRVLALTAGARLVRERLTLPVAGAHDGGYFAVLARVA
jgi:16S rRNA (cytosine967-C5)-methyltransferase